MNTFSEMVRVHVEGYSIALLRDVTGWSYRRARQAKLGHLKADQISFAEAVDFSRAVDLPIENMASAMRH